MELNKLTAISPVDGRYRSKTEALSDYFSEFGLIRYRVMVEVEYFIALCKAGISGLSDVSPKQQESLRKIYTAFSTSDAEKVKDIELEVGWRGITSNKFKPKKYETISVEDRKFIIENIDWEIEPDLGYEVNFA
mgnify:CR=1 FL=1